MTPGDDRLTAADLASMPGLLRAAARSGAIDMAMGFDRIDPPEAIAAAAIEALRSGAHHYVDARGLAELRQAWALSIGASAGAPVDADDELTITAGASGGIFCALMALGCADASVVILDPGYALHVDAARAVGADVVRVPRAPGTWGIDLDRIAAAIERRPRAFVLANPCNPTGAVVSGEALTAIADLCARRGVALVIDEAYADLVFDGPLPSAWRLRPTGVELVVVRSLSKSHRISGWRVGACLAPPALTARIRAVHVASTLGVPTPLQYGALAAFADGGAHLPAMRRDLRAGHDRIAGALTALGARVAPVAGGMFVCADVTATPAADDLAFVQWLYARGGLLVAPGRLFFADQGRGRRFVRVCFARTPEVIEAAVERLQRLSAESVASRGGARR